MKPSHLPTIEFPTGALASSAMQVEDFTDLIFGHATDLADRIHRARKTLYLSAATLTHPDYLDTLARIETGETFPIVLCVLPDDHPAVT